MAIKTKTLKRRDGQELPAPAAEPSLPLYQMLVNVLRTEILSGVYAIGTLLPSEQLLVSRFGVSRHTVRDALRHLRDLGLVESRQGLGTSVLRPGGPQVYVHQVSSISDLHDFNVESRYSDVAEPVILNSALAGRLGVPAGETWLRVDGTRHDQHFDAPICVVEIFVPPRFAGIGRLLGRRAGPIYALIEAVYGESIGEVEQLLRALPVTASIAKQLGLKSGETVVEIRRIYRLIDGEIAEISFNYYNANNFSFLARLRKVRGAN